MNSKECLELAILEYEKETIDDENNQWVKNVLKGLKQIKQDLDRLEQLEIADKNNEGLVRENVELINRNLKLQDDYQKLKERFKKRAELCSEFAEYNRQYEKVLNFLIDKFNLELKGDRLYFLYNNQYLELDKEKEKLMKETLGYE